MKARGVIIVAPHFAEYSERLAAGLAEQVPTVLLVHSQNRAEQVDRPIASNASVKAMPMNRRSHQFVAFILAIYYSLVLRVRLVIIHEGVRQFLKPLVFLLRQFTHVAIIVHDPSAHSGSDSELAEESRRYRRWLREHADLLIVHGNHCRSALIAQGFPEARIVAINHGVLLTPDSSNVILPDARRILMFGRMEAYKGLSVLLDAVALLEARDVPLHVVVAGAGPEQKRLAQAMSMLRSVEAIDRYLAPQELQREIARASFIVAPYVDATQSGVLASTFGNGRPAIASDVGGLGDVVKHDVNGLLVPPCDPSALAAAIEQLLVDSFRTARLAAGARAFAETELNWREIGARILAASGVPHNRRY